MSSEASWTIRHFSLSNPSGPGQESVPSLLRRLASEIERFGQIEIQDIVFRLDLEDDEFVPSMTVYFHGDDAVTA